MENVKQLILYGIAGCSIVTLLLIIQEFVSETRKRRAAEKAQRQLDMDRRNARILRERIKAHREQLWLEYTRENNDQP